MQAAAAAGLATFGVLTTQPAEKLMASRLSHSHSIAVDATAALSCFLSRVTDG